MYERNAIVLERYFYEIFDFKNSSNLRENYYNYRKLFESYGNLCDAKEKEKNCKDEFNNISKEISKLQKAQEKLYNKSAKFEYSRYIIFNNISESVEDIEKHLNKVNEDVQKNSDELKELGQKFVQAIIDYDEKQVNFNKSVAQREKAEEEYEKSYSIARKCYDEITEEKIKFVQDFINSDNKENKKELQSIFEDNGKNEKNQFDQDVILNTINKSIEIYKSEIEVYLAGFDRISKLFEEIETDSVKIDKHTKYYRDSKAKVSFLNSEKDYIIQFLDNERIGAIYDKKTHRKLMLEACKKFALDFAQIDNLYEIILKEAAGRSTKKIYKENYNKEYLIELENVSVEPSLDTGKMRQEAIAFVNLNYWRIEGLRSVYNSFEEAVTTIYEKDLTEFLPEEVVQKEEEENTELKVKEIIEETGEKEEIKELVQKKHSKIYYSSKINLANAIYKSLQTREFAGIEKVSVIEETEYQEEQYSVPENVKEILANVEENEDLQKSELVEKYNIQETEILNDEQDELSENTFDLTKLDEIDDVEEQENELNKELIKEIEITEDSDDEEDSIIEMYINENSSDDKKIQEDTVSKKTNFFRKLVNFNSKEKKKA